MAITEFVTIAMILEIIAFVLLLWMCPLIWRLWLHKPIIQNVQLLHHLQLLPVHNWNIRRDHHWLGLLRRIGHFRVQSVNTVLDCT